MGIEEVLTWVGMAPGAISVIGALPVLIRPGRNERWSAAQSPWVWSRLLVGLGLVVGGFLALGYPRGTWLVLIPGVLVVTGLTLLTRTWIVSRRRARRLAPPRVKRWRPDVGAAGLIERIKNVQFSTTRLVPGYDEQEVDTFLDKLVAALSEDGQLDRSELRDIRFSTTRRLRPGYAVPDVDTFMEELARATW
jgi:DivIVA domain-containing protein